MASHDPWFRRYGRNTTSVITVICLWYAASMAEITNPVSADAKLTHPSEVKLTHLG